MRVLIVSLLIACGSAAAQPKATVLKAARMFDGKGAMTTPGVVVIIYGKIVAVGANASIPSGAEVVDLGDATLLPGFMDAHTHLTSEISDDWKQDALNRMQKPIAEMALDSAV